MTTRRDFLKTALTGGAALTLGGIAPGFSAKSYNNIAGANEKIRIGMIGVNSRGKGIASGLAKLPECEITYVCDVDSRAIEKCQEVVRKITGIKEEAARAAAEAEEQARLEREANPTTEDLLKQILEQMKK